MRKVVLIKLGGSLITDKSKAYTARPRVIRRLGRELKKALARKNRLVILGHGSGSFGHTPAAKYKTAQGFTNARGKLGAARTHDVAAQINRIVMKELIKIGLSVVSVAPSNFITAEGGKLAKLFLPPVTTTLTKGLIPVVYGDVIWDKTWGSTIFSCEKVFASLIRPLKRAGFRVEKIIQAGITDGVYDASGKTISRITRKNFNQIKWQIGRSAATDVTGGMLHKVEESLKLAKTGLATLVINGTRPGELTRALEGKKFKGTEVRH